jgi:2,3-bisphosphoglycerate-dependent phosphoglycerate mutase
MFIVFFDIISRNGKGVVRIELAWPAFSSRPSSLKFHFSSFNVSSHCRNSCDRMKPSSSHILRIFVLCPHTMSTVAAHRLVQRSWLTTRQSYRHFDFAQRLATTTFATTTPSSELSRNKLQDLIVVRHGETEWNRELRVQGITDVPLNEKGRLQAEASAKALLQELQINKPSVIHSSEMLRASDTAQALADILNETSSSSINDLVTVGKHKELNEWNLGVLEGLRKEEASTQHPEDWTIFAEWADPLVTREHTETAVSAGESMEQVRYRVVDCVEKLITESYSATKEDFEPEPIVVVTHGGVLGQLLRHVLVAQYPLDEQEEIRSCTTASNLQAKYHRPKNACITRFMINPLTMQWTITNWASIDHLVGDAVPMDTNYKGSGNR